MEEFWNEGNMSAADELMAPDARIHLPSGEVVNPEEAKDFAARWHESFPDWHSTFEELVAEGDRVAERWTGRGTHQGELQGNPPTGKRVEAPGSASTGSSTVRSSNRRRYVDGYQSRGRHESQSRSQRRGS